VVREHWSTAAQGVTVILAAGRRSIAPDGDCLFGFKAHFSGANDNVELYFFQNCYVGISAIENGATNVCGLAPERNLRFFGFHPGDLLHRCAPLSERLRPLTRTMDWLITGPLVSSERLSQPADEDVYRAGDSLGFTDPFTGSGILNAMLTGELAGIAAARGASHASYLRDCRRLLRRPFCVSSAFRAIIASGMPACSHLWSLGDSCFMPPAPRVEVVSMIEALIRGDNRPSRDLLAAGPIARPFAPSRAQIRWAFREPNRSYENGFRVPKAPGASRTLHTG